MKYTVTTSASTQTDLTDKETGCPPIEKLGYTDPKLVLHDHQYAKTYTDKVFQPTKQLTTTDDQHEERPDNEDNAMELDRFVSTHHDHHSSTDTDADDGLYFSSNFVE